MHRQDLIEKLENYSPEFEEEKEFRASFLQFVEESSNCFERSLAVGHITGSAWIVNRDRTRFLMTHHQKLNRWLQLGGHADGESDIIKVATKEALEESGLTSIKLVCNTIFDIDIHTIPARKQEPEHLHYDVRFLFEADENEQFVVSSESKDLGWLSNDELVEYCKGNRSILRMAKKVQKGSPLSKAPFLKL
ncbi:NUDIX domain-containing protein [Fulvivirga sp. RKSG066]|uniref:NUDIX hydrolase n=1 Tax=Fulvivirga aurantia TaxID=2529383 RepID=UPI0012BC9450|nr:NUDIX hydrolase [Fulvivirga aurantia]MTI21361.1 NUDIX domain-containing protein [Fulvivirga aurantia]